jgi:hypothetical protein
VRKFQFKCWSIWTQQDVCIDQMTGRDCPGASSPHALTRTASSTRNSRGRSNSWRYLRRLAATISDGWQQSRHYQKPLICKTVLGWLDRSHLIEIHTLDVWKFALLEPSLNGLLPWWESWIPHFQITIGTKFRWTLQDDSCVSGAKCASPRTTTIIKHHSSKCQKCAETRLRNIIRTGKPWN